MEGLIVPSITGVCDLQSGLTDGTITPCAQLLVSGKHLDMVGLGSIRLCLVSATECQHVIEIAEVYRHTVTQVIVSIHVLEAGEYFPAVEVLREGKESAVYMLPVSWVVKT